MADPGQLLMQADFGEAPAPVPPPSGPTSKSDCTNGAWRTWEMFKNQGQCIRYVVKRAKKA